MPKKSFTELGLSPELLKAVEKFGWEEAAPIQSEAIPVLMSGRDVVGQSQTGSGKTAAFAIPIIEKVDAQVRAPQALILCPTRELAVQVAEEVAKLAAFKRGIRELPIYGGASYERQFRGLQAGAQIIIGTPGRVMDHLERKSLSLEKVSAVVLDEADRMLDMGFREDIETILSQARPDRQTILFSATLPPIIQQLVKKFTRDPQHIRIEAQELSAPAIEQVYFEVNRRSKLEVLCRLIDMQEIKSGIVFCATKAMVDELTEHLLTRGYQADKLHGDMAQAMRERVMRRFRDRKVELLVATDVAARGLDVDDIEVVFNYDLPQDAEDYVHRIGRTGRAGRAGRAVTFVDGREIWKLQQFMRVTKGRIKCEKVPTLSELEEKQTSRLLQSVRETLEAGEYTRQDAVLNQLFDAGHAATDIASALLHMLAGDGNRAGSPIPEDNPKAAQKPYPKYEPRTGERPQLSREKPYPTRARKVSDDREVPQRKTGGKFAKKAGRDQPGAVSHEPGMVRLAMNVGADQEIGPGDVVGFLAGSTGTTREVIGAIHILPRVTLVDVAEEQARRIVTKVNGMRFKGHKVEIGPAARD